MAWERFASPSGDYDLSHLDPFLLTVSPQDGSAGYRVLVSFGHHTFTREVRAGDEEGLKHAVDGDVRCFCAERHRCSLRLPAIVRASGRGRAYFSQGRNFLLVEDMPGAKGPYAVFFNIGRARAKAFDANLFVVSAYLKPNLPPRRKLASITLVTLIGKTVRGEPITRPKPRMKK
ncbi:hypothetical protein [Caulobacter hibisci]|uniref:Uncharacterized protein n=1 Tax=Caulobacter hibisci TaxID=2035993 RepID=A0ABS0SVX2_9CAUL|nr:hypothetical protein [Caulobacter hibisci]MBI1683416.1 hypothetical protein [Caulobacter hibisci]